MTQKYDLLRLNTKIKIPATWYQYTDFKCFEVFILFMREIKVLFNFRVGIT